MPCYLYVCHDCPGAPDVTTAKRWQPVSAERIAPPCGNCGQPMDRDWRAEHAPSELSVTSVFPYVTTHLNGKPIEVRSESHLQSLCKQHNVRHRPDAAFIENDSGAGMPSSWY